MAAVKPPLDERTCANCRYWTEGARKLMGLCRINPPLARVDVDGRVEGQWPLTMDTDWCGAWTFRQPPRAQ